MGVTASAKLSELNSVFSPWDTFEELYPKDKNK